MIILILGSYLYVLTWFILLILTGPPAASDPDPLYWLVELAKELNLRRWFTLGAF